MGAGLREEESSALAVTQRIIGNVEQIIRGELRLLQVEVVEGVSTVAKGSLLLVAGAGLVQLAVGCLLLGGIYLLGTRWPIWVAAVVVGLFALLAGGGMMLAGRARVARMAAERAKAFEAVTSGGSTWVSRSNG